MTRLGLVLAALAPGAFAAPDIREVEADLEVPALADAPPAPGRRVRIPAPGGPNGLYHVLYLPRDWRPDRLHPLLVEWPGNGGFRSRLGDTCSGRPEGCKLGYGLAAGVGSIWLSLPFVDRKGDMAITWWDAERSAAYARTAVASVCREFGGDTNRVVLTGFSRGAIACNAVGLLDDETARLWCAMIPYSHYDGVRGWPVPNSDPDSARTRLARLGDRPQFVLDESPANLAKTRALVGDRKNVRFAATGFRNHNDAWILRPSPAREALRTWLAEVLAGP